MAKIALLLLAGAATTAAADSKSEPQTKEKPINLFTNGSPYDRWVLKADPRKMEPIYAAIRLEPLELSVTTVRPGEELTFRCSMTNTDKSAQLDLQPMQDTRDRYVCFLIGHFFKQVEHIGPLDMDLSRRKPRKPGVDLEGPATKQGGHTGIPVLNTKDGGVHALQGKFDRSTIIFKPDAVSIPAGLTFEIINHGSQASKLTTKGLANGTYELSTYYTTLEGRLIDTQRAIFRVDDGRGRKKPTHPANDGK